MPPHFLGRYIISVLAMVELIVTGSIEKKELGLKNFLHFSDWDEINM